MQKSGAQRGASSHRESAARLCAAPERTETNEIVASRVRMYTTATEFATQ